MPSIVIPAHNEAGVIARCLGAMTSGAEPEELEILVVCNGCRDATASVARSFAPFVRVIETDVASKSNALNLGDKAASRFPRFYVDADVVLPIDAIRKVCDVLRSAGPVRAAAPRVAFNLGGRGWRVRAFYDVWGRLPYCQEGMVGSGAYAVSEEGRKRFGQFPALTADDAFVRLQFAPEERQTVSSCAFTVTPPATIRDIVKIKTRGHFGNYELRKRDSNAFANEGPRHTVAILGLMKDLRLWPKLAVYLYVRLLSRLYAYRRYHFGDHKHWERDESSRGPASGGSGPPPAAAAAARPGAAGSA